MIRKIRVGKHYYFTAGEYTHIVIVDKIEGDSVYCTTFTNEAINEVQIINKNIFKKIFKIIK